MKRFPKLSTLTLLLILMLSFAYVFTACDSGNTKTTADDTTVEKTETTADTTATITATDLTSANTTVPVSAEVTTSPDTSASITTATTETGTEVTAAINPEYTNFARTEYFGYTYIGAGADVIEEFKKDNSGKTLSLKIKKPDDTGFKTASEIGIKAAGFVGALVEVTDDKATLYCSVLDRDIVLEKTSYTVKRGEDLVVNLKTSYDAPVAITLSTSKSAQSDNFAFYLKQNEDGIGYGGTAIKYYVTSNPGTYYMWFTTGNSATSSTKYCVTEVKVLDNPDYDPNEFHVIILDDDGTTNDEIEESLRNVFYKTYELMYNKYEANVTKNFAPRLVYVRLAEAYYSPASASGDTVKICSTYANGNKYDVDYLTHELAHVTQQYGGIPKPDWMVEGYADYNRYLFGVHPKRDTWFPASYNSDQYYNTKTNPKGQGKNQEMARFMIWFNEKYGSGAGKDDIILTIHTWIKNEVYTQAEWNSESMFPQFFDGKTLDEIYAEYAQANYKLDYTTNYKRIIKALVPEVAKRDGIV